MQNIKPVVNLKIEVDLVVHPPEKQAELERIGMVDHHNGPPPKR